jgi:hypothetical protein
MKTKHKATPQGIWQQQIAALNSGLSPMAKAELTLMAAAADNVGNSMKMMGEGLSQILAGKVPSPTLSAAGITPAFAKAAIAYTKVATSKKRGRFKAPGPGPTVAPRRA